MQGPFRAEVVEHLFGELIRYRSSVVKGLPFTIVSESRPTEAPDAYPELRETLIDKCGQATKGVWWMPWHREATKDVVACDKLREAGKRASIRRFLNAETRLGSIPVIRR